MNALDVLFSGGIREAPLTPTHCYIIAAHTGLLGLVLLIIALKPNWRSRARWGRWVAFRRMSGMSFAAFAGLALVVNAHFLAEGAGSGTVQSFLYVLTIPSFIFFLIAGLRDFLKPRKK